MRVFAFAVLAAAVVAATGGSLPPLVASQKDEKKEKDDKKEKELAKLLDEIEVAMKEKKYKEAIDLAAKAAKLDPKNPGIPFAAASAHAALKQYDEAAKAFTEVVALE